MAGFAAFLTALESRVADVAADVERSLPPAVAGALAGLSINALVLGTAHALPEGDASPVWKEAAARLSRGGCTPADFLRLAKALRGAFRAVAEGMDLPPPGRAGLYLRLESRFDALECGALSCWAGDTEELSARLRQAEEQLEQAQKMEAIGRLTGGIAHDFNNLLTGILGYASLLRTYLPDGGEGHDAAAYIERSARRASELTRQLLAYSRREAPKLRPLEIRRVLGEAIEILSRSVNKNVEIRTDFQAPPVPVMGDPGPLVQALLNLGVNASDAMPSGGVLTFATAPFSSGGDVYIDDVLVPEGRYVSVCVSDTGSGIPESIRDRVFAPFFTTKAPGEGTGLGLSMVYSCVRSHGGFVRLASREGLGTTFQILLPLAEELSTPVEAREPAAGLPRGRETILVIDDEDIPRQLLCDMLRTMGYTALPASSGEEGIRILLSPPKRVDLVILDKIMPGMDGMRTLHRLREIRPGLRVLLCSGYVAEGPGGGTLVGQFDDFLQKPYEMETMARKVRALLDGTTSKS
jgi:signal transduction histidine kinase/CheY-like chemotaxis protein